MFASDANTKKIRFFSVQKTYPLRIPHHQFQHIDPIQRLISGETRGQARIEGLRGEKVHNKTVFLLGKTVFCCQGLSPRQYAFLLMKPFMTVLNTILISNKIDQFSI